MQNKTLNVPDVAFNSDTQLIEIVDLEEIYKNRLSYDHNPEQPHRIGFNAIVIVQSGQGKHSVDFKYIDYQKNYLIFIRKNQIHAFDFSAQLRGKLIVFTDAFIHKISEKVALFAFSPANLFNQFNLAFSPSTEALKSYQTLIFEIDKQLKLGSKRSEIVMHLFCALFLMINDHKPALSRQYDTKSEQKFIQFMRFLEHNFKQSRNAQDYAEQLAISYKTLNQICKNLTQKTAKQLIDSYVILEAKRQIRIELKPVQILAEDLGFDEATNFVKYFKKHTSMTPTEFKNSI